MPPTTAQPWFLSEPDVMEIEDRLDSNTAGSVEEDALLCIESGARRMVLDCHNVSYVSGAGLRAILSLAHAMQIAQGRFIVCGLQPQVEEMFEAVGLSAFIPVYDDQSAALAALAG
jgi:anti-anti-sigma factor